MNYDDMNNLRCGNPDMSSSSGQEENQSLRCQGIVQETIRREDVVLVREEFAVRANRPTRLSGTDGAAGLSGTDGATGMSR